MQKICWTRVISQALNSLRVDGYSKLFYRRAYELELGSDLLDELSKNLPDGYEGAQEFYTEGSRCDLVIVNKLNGKVEVVIECKCQIYSESTQIKKQLDDIEKRKKGDYSLYLIMWTTFVNKLDVEEFKVKPKYFSRIKSGMKKTFPQKRYV